MIICKSRDIYSIFHRGSVKKKMLNKGTNNQKNLPTPYALLFLCSSHHLTHMYLFSENKKPSNFTLSLPFSKNFTSNFSKPKLWIDSGSFKCDSVDFWEIMEFSSPCFRADINDIPKQWSRFHPFDAPNITRSKWSGKHGGKVSHLYLKQFCSIP